jgi:hypothetical protein
VEHLVLVRLVAAAGIDRADLVGFVGVEAVADAQVLDRQGAAGGDRSAVVTSG